LKFHKQTSTKSDTTLLLAQDVYKSNKMLPKLLLNDVTKTLTNTEFEKMIGDHMSSVN